MQHILFSYYVPITAAEQVATACFLAGAGAIGNYTHCSWQTKGYGQFKPLAAAEPTSGEVGKIHNTTELKVEMICKSTLWPQIQQAFLKAHPYETPAYFICKIATTTDNL